MREVTSRERMLAAIGCAEPDHVPCSFMLFNALRERSRDYPHFVEQQVELGLDAYVQVPPRPPRWQSDHRDLYGLPVTHDERVQVVEWAEEEAGERLLVKEYRTPAGTLRVEVRRTQDWPHGEHVPFLDDYLIPRSRKFLVSGPEDLEPLSFLLVPPKPQEVAAFQEQAAQLKALAARHGLLTVGGWGVGADLLGWILGLQNLVFLPYDRPQFLRELLSLVSAWNKERMRVVLAAGVDLYVKRAWYENLDHFTPTSWAQFIQPILRSEVELAHEHGARFGYIITSNCQPLLPLIAEAGVDVVIGVDPHLWDLRAAKDVARGRMCLWGGVNGHLTVEQGSEEEVRQEVRQAIEILGAGGGFILSPVDNVREDTPRAWANVHALLDEWRKSW